MDRHIKNFISQLSCHGTSGSVAKPWHVPGGQHPSYDRFAAEGMSGYTIDGMFHFFGPDGADGQNIVGWERATQWHSLFGIENIWVSVVEDIFGNQFCIRRDGHREVVKMLSILNGEFVTIASDFDGFLLDVVIDESTWQPLRNRFQHILAREGMHFRALHHLSTRVPVILGGSDDYENYEWIDSIVNITVLGQVLQQVRGHKHR
jgi:hypothetical protein